MKKNSLKFIIMAFIAVLTSVGFTSCSDDETIDTYRIVLDNVATNLVDENQNSLANTLYQQLKSYETSFKADYYEAETTFKSFCKEYEAKVKQNLTIPEGGFVYVYWSLQNEDGVVFLTEEITFR